MATVPTPAFSVILRRHRRAAGLTQEALAERAGLSVRGVQDLERGVSRSPRRDTVDLLAAALGLSTEDHAELASAARPLPTQPQPPSPARPALPGASPGRLIPLVGREPELAMLEEFLAAGDDPALRTPPAPVLLLAGEPGIGKSRLLQWAAQVAVARGWTVLASGCHRRRGQDPYTPLLDALARHLHAQPPERLRADLEGCAWLTHLLPELTADPTVGAALIHALPAATLPPEQERRLMFAAVQRMLANATGPAGTLLVLDDLQWAGPDALDLLAALIHATAVSGRQGGPLRVVAAYRYTEVVATDPLGLLVADLAQAGLARHHALGPLAPAEAATLLSDLLAGLPGLNDAVVTRVLERAGGTPFFLISYAQALQAGSAGNADAVPWDLVQGVRQRLALLPEPARGVLGVAAVVGWRAPRTLLMAAAERPEDEILAGLEAACRARLLLDDGDDAYRFAHDVVREVVEADLGAARRAMLHRRVAAALEATSGPVSPEVLAYHVARSDDGARAATYLERAGDDARTRHARAAAHDYYHEAIRRLEGLGAADSARVRRKLGETLHDLNRPDEALAAFAEALARDERQGDRAGQAEAHRTIAAVHAGRYDFTAAAGHLETALALWPAGQEDTGLARLLLDTARIGVLTGDAATSALAERGAALAERLGEAGLRARGAYVLALARSQQGTSSSSALASCDRAVALAHGTGDSELLWRGYNTRAMVRRLRGELADERSDLARAIAPAEQLDLAGPLAHLYQNLAETCRQLGAWAEGRAAARRAHELGNNAHAVLVLLAWMEGDPARAVQTVEEALDEGRRKGDVQHICYLLALLADWRLERGEAAAALAAAREAAALLRAHALATVTPQVYGPLAEAAVAVAAPDAADTLTTASELVERHEAYLARPQLLRASGLLRAHGGHLHQAVATLQESAGIARAQSALLQLGRTLAALRDVAAAAREMDLAAEAEAELAGIVARIGPEVRALTWATAPGAPIPSAY